MTARNETDDYIMPLGKYKGQTLSKIGSSEEGLRYLDWMSGQDWPNEPLATAIKAYVTDPRRRHLVEQAVENGGRRS